MLGHPLVWTVAELFAVVALPVLFTSARRRLAAVLGHLRRSGWYWKVRTAIAQLRPPSVCAAVARVAGEAHGRVVGRICTGRATTRRGPLCAVHREISGQQPLPPIARVSSNSRA